MQSSQSVVYWIHMNEIFVCYLLVVASVEAAVVAAVVVAAVAENVYICLKITSLYENGQTRY